MWSFLIGILGSRICLLLLLPRTTRR
jgi:hypothetical protein